VGQGIRIDCFYCTKIKIDDPDPNCNICAGKITYFRPARMMDRQTSDMQILSNLMDMFRVIIDKDVSFDEFLADAISNTQLISMIEGLMEDFTIYSTNIRDIFVRILQANDN